MRPSSNEEGREPKTRASSADPGQQATGYGCFLNTNVAKTSTGPQLPIDPFDLLAAIAAKLGRIEHCRSIPRAGIAFVKQ